MLVGESEWAALTAARDAVHFHENDESNNVPA
jgi:hypothetical protein